MPVTFIGDVHGQLTALDALLPQAEGQIIFMGDLIDRGPDSRGVLRRVRELCMAGRAACIMGNHEFALVSSLGLPEHGVATKIDFFNAWCQNYGGLQTLLSYAVRDMSVDALRTVMCADLQWMYQLPWYIKGKVDGRRYIAVHAGFNDREPLALQLAGLQPGQRAHWWHSDEQLPPSLYAHQRAHQLPPDLSDYGADVCIVSGHTVQAEVQITPQRLLCDTSGGRPGRQLSGVIWPEGRIISAPTI